MGFIQTIIDWGVNIGIVLFVIAAIIFIWKKVKVVAKGDIPKPQKKAKVIEANVEDDPLYVEVDSFGGKKE